MARLFPKGVFFRPRWDWNLERAMSAGSLVQGVAGQLPFAAISNDQNPSIDLGVFLLYANSNNSGSQIITSWIPGTIGTRLSSMQSIRAGGPAPPVGYFTGNQVAAPGTTLLQVLNGQAGFLLNQPYPFFILPSGYSIIIYCASASQSMSVSFMAAPV